MRDDDEANEIYADICNEGAMWWSHNINILPHILVMGANIFSGHVNI